MKVNDSMGWLGPDNKPVVILAASSRHALQEMDDDLPGKCCKK